MNDCGRPQGRCNMKRRGFTLVELLIVLAILIILFTMVVAVYQTNQGTDRMRAAARQLQSSILGARDRAIHAKAPRGLRLIMDSADPSTVASFIYISQVPNWAEGSLQLQRPGSGGSATSDKPRYLKRITPAVPTESWYSLWQRGLLKPGARIKLPKTGGSWYTVDVQDDSTPPVTVLTATSDTLFLKQDHKTAPAAMPAIIALSFADYELELAAAPLQGEQPISLPSACVIDLDNSRLPGSWWDASTGNYVVNMDIMFSPRGTITGPLAAQGIIHLLLAESGDTAVKLAADSAASPNVSTSLHKPRSVPRTIPPESTQGEKMIVTLFTRTGAVSTHTVDVYAALGSDSAAGVAGTDDDGDGNTDLDPVTNLPDPKEIGYGTTANPDTPRERYRFAETGASAGK